MKGALKVERISLCEGDLEGVPVLGTLEDV